MQVSRLVLSTAIILCVAGCCSSPRGSAVSAADGVASFREGLGDGQNALMSLHSLSIEPGAVVGLPRRTSGSNSAIVEYTDGPDSYLRVETYGKHLTETEMGSIRTAVDSLTGQIGQQLAARVNASRSTNEQASISESIASAQAERDKTFAQLQSRTSDIAELVVRQGDLRRQAAEATGQLQVTEQALNALRSKPEVKDSTFAIASIETLSTARQTQAALEAKVTSLQRELDTVSGEIEPKQVSLNALTQSLQAQNDALTSLQAKDAQAAATTSKLQSAAADGEEQLRKLQIALTEALKKPNVVVFRWNANQDQNQSGSVTGLFGAGATGSASAHRSRNDAVGGYAVMNGFRRIRLVVGQDFRANVGTGAVPALGALANASGVRLGRGAVVTSVIQTREIMYFTAEDIDENLRASIEAKIDQSQALTPEQKLEIQAKLAADYRSLQSVQSSGYFTSPDVRMIRMDWGKLRTDPLDLLPDPMDIPPTKESPTKGWITVHAVTTSVDEIVAHQVEAMPNSSPPK